ncbi:glycosyltransferase family 2 protein [Xylanimonas oleitrophica]|uniref:Glycosyltransferase family 2 protein n=1 Tax=Xylanimonas oleitrophica TaxID=2607479 RepID=A0A2W5X1Z4_9MICO|nr:glycosyltransferase [Xylanimonas oleitrophica]PZR54345.1 glycosyltransferase family 2 protein [Xylanimonas oleitrophica]
MPLDIMLPYWGDPAILKKTVESVFAQTSDDWRLTVVDDAYPDLTVKEWFATIDDPRVRYVRKEQNEGITANYRTCLELATQDYMMFLGSDDMLLPNFVEVVTAAVAAHPGVDVVQPGVQVIDEHDRVVRTLVDEVKQCVTMPRGSGTRVVGGESLATSLLHADWMYWPSLVFRTETVRRTPFRDGFPLIQDLALVIDMILAGGRMLLLPAVCFSYRRHQASASSATLLDGRRFQGERDYFAFAAQQMREHGWRRAERAARLHVTSRLHALTLLPRAVRERGASPRPLLRHAFGSSSS